MWSLPSRSRATALASLAALLLVAPTSAVDGQAVQADWASPPVRQAVSPAIHPAAGENLIANGDFATGYDSWLQYATPDPSHVVTQVTDGVMQFYRVPQPAGERSNQAVVFQWTFLPMAQGAPVRAVFDLANSSSVRKRISVLIHDGDFSDLHVCTFWLAPNAPMQTYRMQTHTTRAWSNTTLSFYAASAGSFGGFYEVDNVSLSYEPSLPADRTLCDDPNAPASSGGSDGPNLLGNGDFSMGLFPWATFHGLTYQLMNGVFEFIWEPAEAVRIAPVLPNFEPAPVVIQRTGQAMASGEILTAHVDLGNSSSVRKRVAILIHQWDFDDLAACTFWLEPGTPLRTYTMRMFATEAWTDAALSVYVATKGPEAWIQLDNAVLYRSPGAEIGGKECYEPGAFQPVDVPPPARQLVDARSRRAPWLRTPSAGSARPPAPTAVPRAWAGRAPGSAGWMSSGSLSLGSLRYTVPPGDRDLTLEISEDGETWQPVHTVSPSDDWRVVTLDLTEFRGPVMFVRVRGS
jgi:hypothetical protein